MVWNLNEPRLEESTLTATVLDELAELFTIGDIASTEYLPAGLMNRNLRIQTAAGTFALKKLEDSSRGDVRRNLAAAAALKEQGLPVPAAVPTRSGDLVGEAAGSEWCLLPWVEGEHRSGPALTTDDLRELGSLLGLIHEGLRTVAALPDPGPPKARSTSAAAASLTCGWYVDLIAAKTVRDMFDTTAAVLLEQRQALITRFASDAPPVPRAGEPSGWTHGDFQDLNVLWDGDEVVAVLDWDRVKPQYLTDEVVRAAAIHCEHGSEGLDLEGLAAFAGGYRTVTGAAAADLAAAADRFWWKRLTDFWPLDFHYERGEISCDHLFLEGTQLLAWWCDHRSEVAAAFTAGD